MEPTAHEPTATIRRRKKWRRSSESSSSASEFEHDDWDAHQSLLADSISESYETSPPNSQVKDGPSLLALPLEIVVHHLLPQLNYPSLLALRLSHPRFYHSPLLYPPRAAAIRLRVAWLLERGSRGLQRVAPQSSGSVDIGTDRTFLANKQVQLMLREERSGRGGSWLPQGFSVSWDRRANLRTRTRWALQWIGRVLAVTSVAIVVVAVTIAAVLSSVNAVMDLLFSK